MRIVFIFLLFTTFFFNKTSAQQIESKTWFSLETNTTPLLFGGYAFGINIRPTPFKNWSLLVGQAGNADFPDWVIDVFRPQNSGKGFDWRVDRARVISIDYFLRKDGTGWYLGQFNFFFKNKVTLNEQTITLNTHIPMVRAGYRWVPFEFGYFYLSPWVGIGSEYRINGNTNIDDKEWSVTRFHYFASINAGIQF